MTLKCTQQQFEALYSLFCKIMQQPTPTISRSLTRDLMEPIYNKLHTRLNQRLNGNKGWNLSLTPIQAKAYYAFFEEKDLGEGHLYEMIIIGKHLEQINKELA